MPTVDDLVMGALPYALFSLVAWMWPTIAATLGLLLVLMVLWGITLPMPAHGRVETPAAYQVPFPGVQGERLTTFYYPGLGASWMQALRYAGKDACLPQGVKARIRNAPLLLYNIVPVDPPEVVTDPLGMLPWFYTALATNTGRAWQRIRNGEVYTLAWPRINFAGRRDIDHCLAAVRTPSSQREAPRLVLAGSSRGASTVLGAVVHMTEEERKRIAFVLLEGAFDTVPAVAAARYGTWAGRWLPPLLSWVTTYDPAFPSPLALAARFPADVPVLFVTSRVDTGVPMASTLALRDAVLTGREGALREQVHTLVLERSHHSFYVNDDLDDQRRYREAMADMYRLYTH